MAYNKRQVLRDNIEAIRTALRLENTKQSPAESDIQALRKYSGFGGLKFILNQADDPKDIEKWTAADRQYFADTQELHKVLHDYSRNDREYQQYVDSLKTSVLTSFYTPKPVVDAIATAMADAGLRVNSMLEPAAGQGVFVDSFNTTFPEAETVAFEKDLITGKILAALHPQTEVKIDGFETIDPDYMESFDIAVSNIPFGDFAVADPKYSTSKEIAYRQGAKSIHNYFFLKALDSVREGGLVAFISSQGVMNAASPFVRMELVKRADLVAAIRLPNNTFSDNAGTDAGSDLIIVQKHTGKKSLSADEEFFIQSVVDRQTNVPNNKYFQAYPQNVICTDAKIGRDPYGKPTLIYKHDGGVEGISSDLRKTLDISLNLRFNKDLYDSNGLTFPTPTQQIPEPPKPTPTQISKNYIDNIHGQYAEMKKKHPDAVLLFRVNDHYMTFRDDAHIAKDVLGIDISYSKLDKRNIPIVKFPHHALDIYLPKLVRAGKRVAICEQLEDPKQKKSQATKQKVMEEVIPANTKQETSSPEPHVEHPDGYLRPRLNKDQDYYSLVATVDDVQSVREFDRFVELGDYESLLSLAAQYDAWNAVNLEETFKDPAKHQNDSVVDEDNDYAVVYNHKSGGQYAIYRKSTESQILEVINRYGIEGASVDIQQLSLDAGKRAFEKARSDSGQKDPSKKDDVSISTVKSAETNSEESKTNPLVGMYNIFGELEVFTKKGRKPVEEVPEVKMESSKKHRLSDEELAFYSSFNWDTNPPINGFYTAMMNQAHAQLKEMEQERQQALADKVGQNIGHSQKSDIHSDISPKVNVQNTSHSQNTMVR